MKKTKICTKCHKRKRLSDFYNDKRNSDGKFSWCKDCYCPKSPLLIKKRKLNRRGLRECKICYKIKNLNDFCGYNCACKLCVNSLKRIENKLPENKFKRKKYYEENKERINKKTREYYFEHKKYFAQLWQQYYKDHREELKIKKKDYYNKNKKKIFDRYYVWRKKYRDNNTGFKILDNFRRRIHSSLKENVKTSNSIKLLGCSIEFLRKHLESQFKEGVNWNNYGRKGWHIDHIYPCASFDLSNPEEQKICFHWSNLQPLWWDENLFKGAKW